MVDYISNPYNMNAYFEMSIVIFSEGNVWESV